MRIITNQSHSSVCSHSGDRPRSFPLFTKTLVLPHISHSRLSCQVWSCDCHRGDFQPYRLFSPHRSIYRGFECSLPEPPILHRKDSRCPSSPEELTIINLFFSIQANGSIYKGNKIGSRLIITLTLNWLKISRALEWFDNHPWNAFRWWYAR